MGMWEDWKIVANSSVWRDWGVGGVVGESGGLDSSEGSGATEGGLESLEMLEMG